MRKSALVGVVVMIFYNLVLKDQYMLKRLEMKLKLRKVKN